MTSILVIQLKRLGDVILTTPALAALRHWYPAARVTLFLDDYCHELAPAIEGVDQIWQYNRKRSLPQWISLFRAGFDLSLDCTGNDRSAIISLLSKAPRRVGFRAAAHGSWRTLAYNQIVPSSVRERHTIDYYLDLMSAVAPANAGPERPSSRLNIPESEREAAHQIRRAIRMGETYFVVHPGSARREKCWPAERWAEVIQFVWERCQLPCAITGGADPAELKHVGEIQQLLPADVRCFTLAGRVNFLITLAVIAQAQFFLGVDTAAAHAAGVFQRPQLVLFGPTNPFHWYARQPFGKVVRAGAPVPYAPENPREKGEPMTSLSTGTVLRTVEDLLRELPEAGVPPSA